MRFLGFLRTVLLGLSTLAPSGPKHGMLKERFVQDGNARIETYATGKGPLIVIVPSASRGAEDYTEFAERLARHGYRVVCVNPRGIENSAPAEKGYSLNDAAEDLAAVIRSEGDGRAIVLGHAAGSFSARLLAVRDPEFVRGVVLAAPGARQHDPSLDKIVQGIAAPDLPEAERRRMLQIAFFATGNDPSSWLTGWYDQHGRLPVIATPNAAPGATDPRNEWWGAGGVPVLEILAEDDKFRPAGTRGEYKAQFGDRVTVVTIPHAGHALFPEQPSAVESAVLHWIAMLPKM